MEFSKRKKLIEDLSSAQQALRSGEITRRFFLGLLTQIAATAGLSLAEVQEANAWVGTRLRRPKRVSSLATNMKSLRFDQSRTTYLTRTAGAPTSPYTWTVSYWFKPALLTANNVHLAAGNTTPNWLYNYIDSNGAYQFYSPNTGGNIYLITTSLFRDFTAWYHITLSVDTTKTVGADRFRLFVNGQLVTSFATATLPALNSTFFWNQNGIAQRIGSITGSAGQGENYLSNFHAVDGQALTPWSFADIDPTSGMLIPKTYSGSYGANGFHLNFEDDTTAASLGTDSSGNNNNWTVINHSVTDQMMDNPLTNFAILNSAASSPSNTLVNGALECGSFHSADIAANISTQFVKKGKWYWEVKATVGATYPYLGIANDPECRLSDTRSWVYAWAFRPAGVSAHNSAHLSSTENTTGLQSFTTGDVISFALDMDSKKLWVGKNGTWMNSGDPQTGTNHQLSWTKDRWVTPIVMGYQSQGTGSSFNFGQGGQTGLISDSSSGGKFKYTPPTGYKAFSAANLPTPLVSKPGQYFGVESYTGNGGVQRIGEIIPSIQTYQVARSLRFNSADSANLTRTPTSAGNRRTWTWSGWVKRSKLSINGTLFSARNGGSGTPYAVLNFDTSDALSFASYPYDSVVSAFYVTTSQLFKDTSRWQHIMCVADFDNAVQADRLQIYVDGVRAPLSSSSLPSSSGWDLCCINHNWQHMIGELQGVAYLQDGYLAEIHFVDGQALGPNSFGQIDGNSGDWVPIQFLGSHGTNGFYLNFSDNSNTTAATLGKDSSGNNNDWTPNNFSVSAGGGNDSLTDSPTNYGTDSGGTAENSRGNYCTLNTLSAASSHLLSNGNLEWADNGNLNQNTLGTLTVARGKWYFEATVLSISGQLGAIGFGTPALPRNLALGQDSNGWGAGISSAGNTSKYLHGNSDLGAGNDTAVSVGHVLMVAVDLDSGKAWFGRQGTWYNGGNPASGSNPGFSNVIGPVLPGVSSLNNSGSGSLSLNFGQRPFAYAPPAGFKCLNTKNLPAVDSRQMTETPDLIWIKSRSSATDHALYDSSRGATKEIISNSTAVESTQSNGLLRLTKTGFEVGSSARINTAGAQYVAWLWKKGVTPGFDVVTYVGNGTNGRQISHNLGAKPFLIIEKGLSTTYYWSVQGCGELWTPTTSNLFLNGDNATNLAGAFGAPSSTYFYPSLTNYANQTGVVNIAYLWTEVDGFSRLGSYTGNGSSDGPFVWCGFRPRFVIFKRTDSTENWQIFDTARAENRMSARLYPNLSNAEYSDSEGVDFLASGFKLRSTSSAINSSSGNYIFIAFAVAPFKYAGAR